MKQNSRENEKASIHRQHDDWDDVHNQMLDVQQKGLMQKKSLTVSNPGDADEKEADEVAQKVTAGESAAIHGNGGAINRKGEGAAEATPEFQSKLENSKGDGHALPENVQQEMGSKMGADFSNVKVHTGSEANAMNENVSAKAFANGNDIYFGNGNYDTQSSEGKELLAHELVHTVQQQGSNKISRAYETDDEIVAKIAKEKSAGKLGTAQLLSDRLKGYLLTRPYVVMSVMNLYSAAMQDQAAYLILATTPKDTQREMQSVLLNFLVTKASVTHKYFVPIMDAMIISGHNAKRLTSFDGTQNDPDAIKKVVDAYTSVNLLAHDFVEILNARTLTPKGKEKYPLPFVVDILTAVFNRGGVVAAFFSVMVLEVLSDATMRGTEAEVLRSLDFHVPATRPGLKEMAAPYIKGIETVTKGGKKYTVKNKDTPYGIALNEYGPGYTEYVQSLFEPTTKVKFKPGATVILPHIRVLGKVPSTNTLGASLNLVKTGEAGSVPAQATPSVPEPGSGVTIGYGYDMKMRTQASVQADLIASGFPKGYIDDVKTGAGKEQGWIDDNVTAANKAKWADHEADPLVQKAIVKLLEDVSYPASMQEAMRRMDEYERDYQKKKTGQLVGDSKIPFDTLDPIIIDITTDLMFGGQMVKSTWEWIRESVLKNDVGAFTEKMLDDKMIGRTRTGGRLYKRFNQRMNHMVTRQIERLNGYIQKETYCCGAKNGDRY